MKVIVRKSYVTIWREKGEPRVKDESQMLHRLKLILNERGHDLIKKIMHKDGHLVDGLQHYLRARKQNNLKRGRIWAIHDPNYSIYDSARWYNQWGRVTLTVERE